MLQLHPFKDTDAVEICRWPQSETEFYYWSAGKLGNYPAKPTELIRFYAEPENRFCGFFSVFDLNTLCGHFTLRYMDDARTALRLGFIILNPAYRGRGYGKKMLVMALTYSEQNFIGLSISLNVFSDNIKAIQCYKSVGFRLTGESKQIFLPNGHLCQCHTMKKMD